MQIQKIFFDRWFTTVIIKSLYLMVAQNAYRTPFASIALLAGHLLRAQSENHSLQPSSLTFPITFRVV